MANKSTEASKNIAALIETPMNAVENGTQIADDTAQSLIQAVQDVNEMTGIITQISQASSDQADSIFQITSGIDQISSVVQTNPRRGGERCGQRGTVRSGADLKRIGEKITVWKATAAVMYPKRRRVLLPTIRHMIQI